MMTEFQIPRSRAYLTHRTMQEELFQALEPILFEPHQFNNLGLKPLEEQFAQYIQRSYAYGVNSGTAGLFLALQAYQVGPGDEVITVGNSDISTTAVISHSGATPVLCDILETDHTIDPNQVESLITARTKAILPVDLYGHPADVKSLRAIADRHGLKIVEDATLSTGAWDYGRPAGAFADVAVYSFGAHKPLGSVGNGGIVVTDDPALAERLFIVRSYGRTPGNLPGEAMFMDHALEGYNLPLDLLQAAVVLVKLPFLDEWTQRRGEIAALYAQGLADSVIGLPVFRPDSRPTFYSYVVRIPNRDFIYTTLRERGIEAGLHYVPPVYRQTVYQGGQLKNTVNLPVTDRLAAELLGLPIAPELSDEEVNFVIETLKELLTRST